MDEAGADRADGDDLGTRIRNRAFRAKTTKDSRYKLSA
jgi:hypothetical protein